MTWTYKRTENDNLSVYDHTDTYITTVTNDGNGMSVPGDVLDVMMQEAVTEYSANGFTDRVFAIMRDAMFEQIEEK